MSILTDIYNTVAKFFRPQEGLDDGSKSVAANRLKLVLMQDRTNLTPKILEQMRGELIDLLSRYVELDKELLELNFEQEGDQVALMLSIPVIRAKDEEEIEAALNSSKKAEKEDEHAEEAAENSEERERGTEDDTQVIEAEKEPVETAENDKESSESSDDSCSEELEDKSLSSSKESKEKEITQELPL